MTTCQTCHSLCGTHLNGSKPLRRSCKRPHSFPESESRTGCYYHFSFQWTYAGPSFKSQWWMLHKQTTEVKPDPPRNPPAPPPSITYKVDCCDKVDWAGSHPDLHFTGLNSDGVISVSPLHSHWVSGSPLVRNTSRPPHFDWLVCREKRGRGNHYSFVLLLAWDEALNPACMRALRGHWENNAEKQHEWWGKRLQSLVPPPLLVSNNMAKWRKRFEKKALLECQLKLSCVSLIIIFKMETVQKENENLVTTKMTTQTRRHCNKEDFWGRWAVSVTPGPKLLCSKWHKTHSLDRKYPASYRYSPLSAYCYTSPSRSPCTRHFLIPPQHPSSPPNSPHPRQQLSHCDGSAAEPLKPQRSKDQRFHQGCYRLLRDHRPYGCTQKDYQVSGTVNTSGGRRAVRETLWHRSFCFIHVWITNSKPAPSE